MQLLRPFLFIGILLFAKTSAMPISSGSQALTSQHRDAGAGPSASHHPDRSAAYAPPHPMRRTPFPVEGSIKVECTARYHPPSGSKKRGPNREQMLTAIQTVWSPSFWFEAAKFSQPLPSPDQYLSGEFDHQLFPYPEEEYLQVVVHAAGMTLHVILFEGDALDKGYGVIFDPVKAYFHFGEGRYWFDDSKNPEKIPFPATPAWKFWEFKEDGGLDSQRDEDVGAIRSGYGGNRLVAVITPPGFRTLFPAGKDGEVECFWRYYPPGGKSSQKKAPDEEKILTALRTVWSPKFWFNTGGDRVKSFEPLLSPDSYLSMEFDKDYLLVVATHAGMTLHVIVFEGGMLDRGYVHFEPDKMALIQFAEDRYWPPGKSKMFFPPLQSQKVSTDKDGVVHIDFQRDDRDDCLAVRLRQAWTGNPSGFSQWLRSRLKGKLLKS
ncbi:hypothetical protein FB446DRAFT_720749 [Lentinula raphanica]|nr:hypothetical protein FB446DRAFT_720749 [Lentinula raphanica]